MDLEKIVSIFLQGQGSYQRPLLLGFSGGTDSLALAHCLLTLKVEFHLAHFDHRWRQESGKEREDLQRWAEKMGIPFHFETSISTKKSEILAREERYNFFASLYSSGNYHALVLAHHKQDQEETILKRIFEGARFVSLGGMSHTSYRGTMRIWRPFLTASKKTILSYLQNNQLSPIQDETNRDPKYLRSRLRHQIFPFLAQTFGKNILPSLSMISEESRELKNYMEEKTALYLPILGPFGKMWDFKNVHPYEIQYVLSQQLLISKKLLKKIVEAIGKGTLSLKLSYKKTFLIVDKNKLFFIEKSPPKLLCMIPLKEGAFEIGDWRWEIKRVLQSSQSTQKGWLDFWQGRISLQLSPANYFLSPPSKNLQEKRRNIPSFLRSSLPSLTLLIKDQPFQIECQPFNEERQKMTHRKNFEKTFFQFPKEKIEGKDHVSFTVMINPRR